MNTCRERFQLCQSNLIHYGIHLLLSCLGLCVLELEGHSLRGASFEDVRRIMKTIRSAVVKLVVKDCKYV